MFENRDIIQQIKDRISIVDVIGQRVKLQRKGTSYFGICPFHNEKTSSFSVNPARQIFHCFGCGKKGDVFEFVQAYENISFKEALDMMAGIAGVEIPKPKQKSEAEKTHDNKIDTFYKINAALKEIYHNNLFSDAGKDARDYLRSRHIKEDTWRDFGLGFASKTTTEYYSLMDDGFDEHFLKESGNFLTNGSTRFFGRLIFPIEDIRKRVVGFGGRILVDEKDSPKYLNSPESAIFKKREIFFGENKINRSLNKLIITEGYLDVISMVSNGFPNTVAPLGTAISEEHVKKALRFADAPLVALDGDVAGLHAMYSVAEKILPVLKDDGRSFVFVKLPQGADLDSMVHGSKEELKELLDHPVLLVDMLKEKLESEINVNSPEKKLAMVREIRRISDTVTHSLLKKFYYDSLIKKIFVENKLSDGVGKKITLYKKSLEIPKIHEKSAQQDFLLGLVIQWPQLLDEIFEQFLNLDCNDSIKDYIISVYSGDSSVNGKLMLDKLKTNGYNSLVKRIFENSIHFGFCREYRLDQLSQIWLNIYNKVQNQKEFGTLNKLKKWKTLTAFKKKIDLE